MEDRPKFSLLGTHGQSASSHSLSPFVFDSSGPTTPSSKRRLVDASSLMFAASPASSELRRVQQRTAGMEIEVQRLQTQLSLQAARHESALSSRDARISELEKDRRFLFENEGKQRNELECLKREKDQQLSSLKLRLTECEGKSRELEEKLCTMETDLRRSQRLAAQCREELETATRRHQQDVKAIQDTLAAKQEIINDQRHKITSLEQALDQPPKQSETEALPSPFLSSVVTANGESLLEKIHRLEVHNRKLQFDNSIFREASAAQRIIEEKLFAAEQRLVQFQQLEAENARLQSQLQSETDHERPRSPSTVAETIIQHHDTRSIRDLLERTMTLAKLEASIGEMKARNAGLEAEVTDTRQQLEATKQQLQDRTAELDSVNVALLQTRQQQTLLRTEVSNVKEQLEAAEKMEQASHSIIQNLSKKLA